MSHNKFTWETSIINIKQIFASLAHKLTNQQTSMRNNFKRKICFCFFISTRSLHFLYKIWTMFSKGFLYFHNQTLHEWKSRPLSNSWIVCEIKRASGANIPAENLSKNNTSVRRSVPPRLYARREHVWSGYHRLHHANIPYSSTFSGGNANTALYFCMRT